MQPTSESNHPWSALELSGPATEREIKRAYALLAKRIRPDVDAEGFQHLRSAYELALHWATPAEVAELSLGNSNQHLHGELRQEIVEHQLANQFEHPVSETTVKESAVSRNEEPELLLAASNHKIPVNDLLAEEQDLQGLIEELHALSLVSYEIAVPLTDAQASRLHAVVLLVIEHPALLNLSTALRAEEQLLALAGNSNMWPADSLKLLWSHYHLESRLAFSASWSVPSSIHRQIEDHDRWSEMRQLALREPQSTSATLMRDIDFSDRWRLWVSYDKRSLAHEQLAWVQQRPLLIKPDLNTQSVIALTKWLQFVERWPHLGISGWMFLLACSLGSMNSLSDWLNMPLIRTIESLYFLLVTVFLYVVCAVAKRWLLPAMQQWQHKAPRIMDASELAAAWLVVLSFGAGGWTPILSAATLFVAGVWLLSCWAIHNRLRPFLSAVSGGDNLGGFVVLLASALGILYTLAPNPNWFGYPMAVLAIFQGSLRNPPLMLDRWAWRYQWRSGQPVEVALRTLSIFALLLMAATSFVILYQRGLYAGNPSSGAVFAVLAATWLVFGIFTGASLSQHFRASLGGFSALAYPLALIAVVTAFQQQLDMKGVGLWHLAVATSIGMAIVQTLFAQYTALRVRA